MLHDRKVEAAVTAYESKGNRSYAVSVVTNSQVPDLKVGETVTFSRDEWNSKRDPKVGQVVYLSEIEKFTKGWRARKAEPFKL